MLGGTAASSLGGMVDVRNQAARIYRIGILETVPAEVNVENLAALRRGLREHGYFEGQNLRIEYRSAEGRADRFPDLAAELIRLGVDLIVTRGTPAAKAAKTATATIPVVMAAIGEPLGVGVVASLAHPGGNVTGLSAFVTVLSGKRIELLKETFPSIAHVGLLQNMEIRSHRRNGKPRRLRQRRLAFRPSCSMFAAIEILQAHSRPSRHAN